MKFEEILPHLREGRRIARTSDPRIYYRPVLAVFNQDTFVLSRTDIRSGMVEDDVGLAARHFLADDWFLC